MQEIKEIQELVKYISKLPGLGPKSARRIILKLINNREEILKPMSKALSDVLKNILRCNSCGALKSNNSICANCEENKDIAKKHNIDGFPTIKYFPNGLNDSSSAIVYENERDLQSIKDFINKQ